MADVRPLVAVDCELQGLAKSHDLAPWWGTTRSTGVMYAFETAGLADNHTARAHSLRMLAGKILRAIRAYRRTAAAGFHPILSRIDMAVADIGAAHFVAPNCTTDRIIESPPCR
jgi:hypothetical protein